MSVHNNVPRFMSHDSYTADQQRGQRSEPELQSISPALHPAQVVDCRSPVDLNVSRNGSSEACPHLARVSAQHVQAGAEPHLPSGPSDIGIYNTDKTIFERESPWIEIDQLDHTTDLESARDLNLHQACFLKYYIDNIASWVRSVGLLIIGMSLTRSVRYLR